MARRRHEHRHRPILCGNQLESAHGNRKEHLGSHLKADQIAAAKEDRLLQVIAAIEEGIEESYQHHLRWIYLAMLITLAAQALAAATIFRFDDAAERSYLTALKPALAAAAASVGLRS